MSGNFSSIVDSVFCRWFSLVESFHRTITTIATKKRLNTDPVNTVAIRPTKSAMNPMASDSQLPGSGVFVGETLRTSSVRECQTQWTRRRSVVRTAVTRVWCRYRFC